MSDQHSTARPAPQTPTRPSRPRRDFAVAAVLTLVVAGAVYVALGYFLGITGFLIALVAWLITLGYGASRRTPTGWGITTGCLLLVLASVIGVIIESINAPM